MGREKNWNRVIVIGRALYNILIWMKTWKWFSLRWNSNSSRSSRRCRSKIWLCNSSKPKSWRNHLHNFSNRKKNSSSFLFKMGTKFNQLQQSRTSSNKGSQGTTNWTLTWNRILKIATSLQMCMRPPIFWLGGVSKTKIIIASRQLKAF